MEVAYFIENYRAAFGEKAELPLAFWYSDTPLAETGKVNGCLFKTLHALREGSSVSLSLDNSGCGGGKFYTGFTEMPAFVPQFVSLKEHYKQTPEMVLDFVEQLDVPAASAAFLNITRLDNIASFDSVEALIFLATPDILSGLVTWTLFDTNAPDAVSTLFGSGCSATITSAINENRAGGKRTFLGFFDPSVRPYVDAGLLSFTVPMSRFREMYETMPQSCLFNTHAWEKVKERINNT